MIFQHFSLFFRSHLCFLAYALEHIGTVLLSKKVTFIGYGAPFNDLEGKMLGKQGAFKETSFSKGGKLDHDIKHVLRERAI